MSVAVFEFTVGKSFLDYAFHPITIPQDVDPQALGLDIEAITVVLPRGERLEAKIHHGPNNTTVYNQVRSRGGGAAFPNYLQLDDKLLVLLFKSAGYSYAVIEYGQGKAYS